MKRLLLNCDQVFDVLTRGPFPTGEPEDDAVEQHLRACHECRQLAEALRPAVALLHEVVTAEEAIDLPEYQGSLASEEPPRLTFVRLAAASKPDRQPAASRNSEPSSQRLAAAQRMLSLVRFVSTSLVALAIVALLLVAVIGPQDTGRQQAGSFVGSLRGSQTRDELSAMPGDQGLLTLASLKLPVACMPLTHRPLSAEHAAQIAAALSSGSMGRLHCCTECHHAGTPQRLANVAAISMQSCQACHRG